MIDERSAMQLIIQVEPAFSRHESLGPQSATDLGDFVAGLILAHDEEQLARLTSVINRLLREGDPDVRSNFAAYFDSAFVQRIALGGGILTDAATAVGVDIARGILALTSMYDYYRATSSLEHLPDGSQWFDDGQS